MVKLSQPLNPARTFRGESSSTSGRHLARLSTSTEGRIRLAGMVPKTVTPPRELPTAGADQEPAVAWATGPWGRTSHRLASNRTATATARASGANDSASDRVRKRRAPEGVKGWPGFQSG